VLTAIVHTELEIFELSWSFSIWLEALAIIPQLHMLQKIKEVFNYQREIIYLLRSKILHPIMQLH